MFRRKALLYFNKNFIEIYLTKIADPIKIEIDSTHFPNLDTIDKEFISKSFADLESNSSLKFKFSHYTFILILSDDLVFSKSIKETVDVIGQKDILNTTFLEKVPLKPDCIVSKFYSNNDNLIFTATNNEIINTIVMAVKNLKGTIIGVYPKLFLKNDIKSTEISKIFKDLQLYRYGNYIYEYKPKSKKLVILEWILFYIYILSIISAFFTILYFYPEFLDYIKQQFISILPKNLPRIDSVTLNLTDFFTNLFSSIQNTVNSILFPL